MNDQHIDYLQFSSPTPPPPEDDPRWKLIPPLKFYKFGYEDKLGVRMYFGNPNSNNALTVMSGKCLHNHRVVGYDDRELIENSLAAGAKISRIDWCITDYVDDALVTPQIVAEECEAGRVAGTLAKYGYVALSQADVGQPASVQTTYIGSPKRRSKNGIFRAYDKGIELGIMADIIGRIELEERRDNAHTSARRFAEGASVAQVIESRIQFSGDPLRRLLDEPPLDVTRGAALQQSDERDDLDRRWKWLIQQVAPALRDALAADRQFGLGNARTLEFLRKSGILVEEQHIGDDQ